MSKSKSNVTTQVPPSGTCGRLPVLGPFRGYLSSYKSRIGITLGDPRGIGPEVIQKALRRPDIRKVCTPILFGDPHFFDWKKTSRLTAKECGHLAGHYIEQAVHAALKGEIDAIVTGPICKENLQKGGTPFPGHTEFLAHLTGTKEVRMMMTGPRLRVVLATIHEPLREVASRLTKDVILKTITLTDHTLKSWFGIQRPRIAVAALNPHAGESGIFGDEEDKKILPAVAAARRRRIQASGPYPPDTVFYRAVQGEFDAVIAMYHDQGLIPLKLLHFDEAVNITLGLPIVRVGVDHGTAFDIAGKNVADATSMTAAIKLAAVLARIKK